MRFQDGGDSNVHGTMNAWRNYFIEKIKNLFSTNEMCLFEETAAAAVISLFIISLIVYSWLFCQFYEFNLNSFFF